MGARDVFINCPFDERYKPTFDAIVFTGVRSGFQARCAQEGDNAAESRLAKIYKIIKECSYSIHDISETSVAGDPPLPRFNMPFELGLFLGAKEYGGKHHKDKRCMIFERTQYLSKRYMSDLSGHDVEHRDDNHEAVISKITNWLRRYDTNVPGGTAMITHFNKFMSTLPEICKRQKLSIQDLTFTDLNTMCAEYSRVTAEATDFLDV